MQERDERNEISMVILSASDVEIAARRALFSRLVDLQAFGVTLMQSNLALYHDASIRFREEMHQCRNTFSMSLGGISLKRMLLSLLLRRSSKLGLRLAVTKSVGNSYSSDVGGEVFYELHLAMLPHSIHPDGHVYSWVQEPQQPQAPADLAALGLVPDQPNFEADKGCPPVPTTPEVQDEFTALMAEQGIERRHRSQELVSFRWHDDAEPSIVYIAICITPNIANWTKFCCRE